MRGFLASTAVLGVIAVGGVPALGLVMTGEETTPSDQRTATGSEREAEGPPPWAAQGKNRTTPPGWARNHGGAAPHGWAVREWAHCVAAAAQGLEPGQRLDRAGACGEKPAPPGQAKKPDKAKQPKAGRSG